MQIKKCIRINRAIDKKCPQGHFFIDILRMKWLAVLFMHRAGFQAQMRRESCEAAGNPNAGRGIVNSIGNEFIRFLLRQTRGAESALPIAFVCINMI